MNAATEEKNREEHITATKVAVGTTIQQTQQSTKQEAAEKKIYNELEACDCELKSEWAEQLDQTAEVEIKQGVAELRRKVYSANLKNQNISSTSGVLFLLILLNVRVQTDS